MYCGGENNEGHIMQIGNNLLKYLDITTNSGYIYYKLGTRITSQTKNWIYRL